MTASRFLAAALTALLSAAALAQEASAPATPDPAVRALPAPCVVQGARHDHGAEKGTPTLRTRDGCPMAEPSASAAMTKPKVKPGHDHSKFHKLM